MCRILLETLGNGTAASSQEWVSLVKTGRAHQARPAIRGFSWIQNVLAVYNTLSLLPTCPSAITPTVGQDCLQHLNSPTCWTLPYLDPFRLPLKISFTSKLKHEAAPIPLLCLWQKFWGLCIYCCLQVSRISDSAPRMGQQLPKCIWRLWVSVSDNARPLAPHLPAVTCQELHWALCKFLILKHKPPCPLLLPRLPDIRSGSENRARLSEV